MGTTKVYQSPKAGRRTTGEDSLFHGWRVHHHMTQSECARLLGVTATTIQRWDAHEHAAPAVLEPALLYHDIMLDEIDELRDAWDYLDRYMLFEMDLVGLELVESVIAELAKDMRSAVLVQNIKGLGATATRALLYGIKHGLFR